MITSTTLVFCLMLNLDYTGHIKDKPSLILEIPVKQLENLMPPGRFIDMNSLPAKAVPVPVPVPVPAGTVTAPVPRSPTPTPARLTPRPTPARLTPRPTPARLTPRPTPARLTPRPTPNSHCSGLFGGVKPHVGWAASAIAEAFKVNAGQILGVGSRSIANSDHPKGLAVDFVVNRTLGDKIADFVIANWKEFSIKYVIWRQRYNDGELWEPMENRGSVTANHMDHVHISFQDTGKGC